MKPEPIIVNTLDRPATWEEIRRATSSAPEQVLEFWNTQGNFCEVDSDLGGVVRYPAEEFEFFSYLSEMYDKTAN